MSKDKDKCDVSYHEPFIDTTVQTTDYYCSNMIFILPDIFKKMNENIDQRSCSRYRSP